MINNLQKQAQQNALPNRLGKPILKFAKIIYKPILLYTGKLSCRFIKTFSDITTLICNGSYVCNAYSTFQNIYNVACTGYSSCSNYSTFQNVTNLLCNGNSSCSDRCNFLNINAMTCNGHNSCKNNKVYYVIDRVDCVGKNSCANSIFLNVDDLTCLDSNSCIDIINYEGKCLLCFDENDIDCSNSYMNLHDNFDAVFCVGRYSCNHSTFANIDFVICHDAYSCNQVTFKNVNEIICDQSYSCNNAKFKDISYNKVDCVEDYSCTNVKGNIKECPAGKDVNFVCNFGDICGYVCNEKCSQCTAYCYGNCFCASNKCFEGVAGTLSLSFPFDTICVRWYYCYIFLVPTVMFWSIFIAYWEDSHQTIDYTMNIFKLEHTYRYLRQNASRIETVIGTDVINQCIKFPKIAQDKFKLHEISNDKILLSQQVFYDDIETHVKQAICNVHNVYIPDDIWNVIFQDYLYPTSFEQRKTTRRSVFIKTNPYVSILFNFQLIFALLIL